MSVDYNLQKMYLKTNIIIFILSLNIFNLLAQDEEKITISFSSIPLSEAIKNIQEKSNYTFFYNSEEIDIKTKVSLTVNDILVADAVRMMLKPTNVATEILNRQIVLLMKEKTTRTQNTITVSGIVLDDITSEPLPGVTITTSLVGSKIAAFTDDKGHYSLVIPETKSQIELQYSYIGYNTRKYTLGHGHIINARLKLSSSDLEEIVVVGYGVQKKESVVGSVQVANPSALRGTSSQLSANFAGRIAGIIAVQRSGQPGADGTDFRIRGTSSFSGNTTPLILMDGVQINTIDLNSIDTETIDKFSILKDATATSLYGILGANGVLLITTKKGQILAKPKISIRIESSLNIPIRKPKTVDGITY